MAIWLLYAGIFVGLLFEGDLLLFGTTFLVLTGKLDGWIMLPLAVVAVLLGDVGWYYAGERLAKKPDGRPATILRKITRILDGRVARSPRRIIFVSKLTYGLHRPILMRFGLEKFGALNFFKVDLPAVFAWFLTICSLAVLAHLTLLPVSKYLRVFELVLLTLFLAYILTESRISHLLRRLLPKDVDDAWYTGEVDQPPTTQP